MLFGLIISACTCENIDILPSPDNVTSMSAAMFGDPEGGPYSGPSIKEFEFLSKIIRKY